MGAHLEQLVSGRAEVVTREPGQMVDLSHFYKTIGSPANITLRDRHVSVSL